MSIDFQAQGALASFCRYAREEHIQSRKAQSALNESEPKDAEIERLKGEVHTLQATLKSDQEVLTKVRSSLNKMETEWDFGALQTSAVQGELDQVKKDLVEFRRSQWEILDKFRASDEYDDEVVVKSFVTIKKTRDRAVYFLMGHSNGTWEGFFEEFIRINKVEDEESPDREPEEPLERLNFEMEDEFPTFKVWSHIIPKLLLH